MSTEKTPKIFDTSVEGVRGGLLAGNAAPGESVTRPKRHEAAETIAAKSEVNLGKPQNCRTTSIVECLPSDVLLEYHSLPNT